MNGLYKHQAGITFRISGTRVSTRASQDNLSSTRDPRKLLRELSTSRNVDGADLVHLFTGRRLEGGLIGIAAIGGICHNSQSTGRVDGHGQQPGPAPADHP